MQTLAQILLYLTKGLYPTGRAFRIPIGSTIEKIHKGLAISEEEAYTAATSGILDTILPDNPNFTADDAADWERRLGIIGNSATALADRKLAISRKYASPGDVPARQHYLYLEGQLQAAGFDVYVHENRPVAQVPSDFAFYSGGSPVQLGQSQLGQSQLGSINIDLIANSINPEKDFSYSIGSDTRAIFFIGGAIKGDAANVPLIRKEEFRQLVLQIKPVQTVAVLFLNYT